MKRPASVVPKRAFPLCSEEFLAPEAAVEPRPIEAPIISIEAHVRDEWVVAAIVGVRSIVSRTTIRSVRTRPSIWPGPRIKVLISPCSRVVRLLHGLERYLALLS